MKILGVMPINLAERLVSLAASQGIQVEKIHNQKTCTKGCSISVEVWVDEADAAAVQSLWLADQQRNYLGLSFQEETIGQVYDTNKETAICPACAHEFKTSLSECPSCGLCF